MSIKANLCALAVVGAGLTHAGFAGAQCTVNFNDSAALSMLTYSEQCISFVVAANPYSSFCPFPTPSGYRGKVIENWTPAYSHYHLAWEDSSISCFASDGCFGRMSGGSCQVVNHLTQPRYVTSHTNDHWIQVALTNSEGRMLVRTFSGIRIRGTASADVWYQKTDGTWHVINNLGPGNWSIGNGSSVFRVALHQDSGGSPFSFDDVRFTP